MGREEQVEPKLFVALDVDSANEAFDIIREVSIPYVGIKLGPRLINRYGADFISKVAQAAPVFVDLKFFDIPNTMLSSVKAVSDAGASYVTIHALCGSGALHELRLQEKEIQSQKDFRLLAVTVLTSFNPQTLPSALKSQPIDQLVTSLASDVFASGIQGVVASALEASSIRGLNPEAFIVTPGVRPAGESADDQSRIVTPEEAKKKGASAIVVGRPILRAQNKRASVEALLQDLI